MSKRILLACYEVPGWGGASTYLYQLFRRMQRDSLDVSYVNLVEEADAVYFRYLWGDGFGNPLRLENVVACILRGPLWQPHAAIIEIIRERSPEILVGCGFFAARLLELAAPQLPTVFMTSGSHQLKRLIERGHVKDFMDFRARAEGGLTYPVLPDDPEERAAAAADLIIVHSPLVRFAFEHFFPWHMGKVYTGTISPADVVYAESGGFAALRRRFAERDVDVMFVANDWGRPEKNYGLAKSIASHCRDVSVHIVGELHDPHPPGHPHGLVADRERFHQLLGQTKTVVCPSLMDAAPGVLFEASAMGCNVIASKNCGNWQLCSDRLVPERCALAPFLDAIEIAVSAPVADNGARFRGGYQELVDTLTAV